MQSEKLTPQFYLLIFLFACVLAPPASAEAPKLIPLEELARLPLFSGPQLSPEGTHVAAMMLSGGQKRLVVQNLYPGVDNPLEQQQISLDEYQFAWYDWANNDRLLLGIRVTTGVRGDLWNLTRIGSISRTGKDYINFPMDPNNQGLMRQNANIINKLEKDNDHVLAALDDIPDGWAEPQVHRVNVYTGKRELVERNRRGIFRWIADNDGQLRIGVRYALDRGRRYAAVSYRETENDSWQELQKTDYFDHERLEPYRFDEDDPNILLVSTASLEANELLDESRMVLYRYDLLQRKIVGEYINQDIRDVVAAVEKALPDMTVQLVSIDEKEKLFFFRVYTDTLSPEYYLLNKSAAKLDYVAAEYPKLIDYTLAAMKKVSYTARDGLEIPAFMTLPAGVESKKLPFIIYPHGGPWAHDEWGFDNYVQFFANRGYGVFQPQFRGSTGLGIEHEEAGYGEWGYAIQDDITDGVKWLIDQGIADPDRICIVGSSFGGYAAAIGLAKSPELYACGISINGVMDLKYFIHSANKNIFGKINKAMWNSLAEAEEASPYHLSAQIRAPLLLIASERDTVVPAKHTKRMYKKMKGDKQAVSYEELPDGEHWRTNEALELKKFALMEEFLAEHLDAGQRQ